MKALLLLLALLSCHPKSDEITAEPSYKLSLTFTRIPKAGPDPFRVKALGLPADAVPTWNVPEGTVKNISPTEIEVTPKSTGIYPVTVAYQDVSFHREALVLNDLETGAGQPLLVPGMVNSDGYEDGITVTPDGEYLFIQYGPLHFSGIFLHKEICAEPGWSMYDLTTCPDKDDSSWVFETIGPFNNQQRPDFPVGAIKKNKLQHIDITVPGVAHKIALFPTVFYGFRRASDDSFNAPFMVAFNDLKGANSPFGLSFKMTGPERAEFVVAWNNFYKNLGDEGADIYHGVLSMNTNTNLGDVEYEVDGPFFESISPNIEPMPFTTHHTVTGNPSWYENTIWTDDEESTHDLTVWININDVWTPTTLPSKINTAGDESQPFFNGKRLYMNRNLSIVYHEYLGGNYANNSSWGPEVLVLKSGDTHIGGIFGVGEPTIAIRNGKSYLYFAYVEARAAGEAPGRVDYDLGAAYVELP